ncbi:methyltransferase domain-containing protein [Saccharopolyspora dendranthemae]|nr:methyltransferase domain-containing protein [Saccharopolyspora dendranthemae]
MTEQNYMFNTAETGEHQRLLAHAQVWDPVTFRRLKSTGLGEGWRCLEVGAGSGTVTEWLAEQVGHTGHVVATDLETKWIRGLGSPNVDVVEHDIRTDQIGESVYDLITLRLVMTHLPDKLAVLGKLGRALVPGGWLLVEDYDMRVLPVFEPPDATCSKVAGASAEAIRAGGGDPYLGAKLPGLLSAAGLTGVETEAVAFPRRMPAIRSWRTQVAEMRDRLVGAGLVSADEVDLVLARFDDEYCELVVYGPLLVSARGRRPA